MFEKRFLFSFALALLFYLIINIFANLNY